MAIRHRPRRALVRLVQAIGLALLICGAAAAQSMPSRPDTLALMNRGAPFDNFHRVYVCDVTGVPASGLKSRIEAVFAKPAEVALLKRCNYGEVDSIGKNSNYHASVVFNFSQPDRLARLIPLLGDLGATNSWDGYDHRKIYWTRNAAGLAKAAGGFATAEPARAPFTLVTLKTFRSRVGGITGIRAPRPYSAESECTAIVEYTFEIIDKAPWADDFLEQTASLWTGVQRGCLVHYDDGWRLKEWRMGS